MGHSRCHFGIRFGGQLGGAVFQHGLDVQKRDEAVGESAAVRRLVASLVNYCLIFGGICLLQLMVLTVSAEPAKLLHYGWDNPSIAALTDVLPKLKTSAFDGLTARPSASTPLFASKIDLDNAFKSDLVTLQSVDHAALKQSYLAVLASADEKFDWNDDAHWALALENFRHMAQLAKTGGFKGLVFDMEPYSKNPWSYGTQPAKDRLSFGAFQILVQKRGADAMHVMQQEYPGVQIVNLYALSALNYSVADVKAGKDANVFLADEGYGLWPSFFAGWVEAADASTTLIEGNEPSYYYTRRAEFESAKAFVKNDLSAFLPKQLRGKYTERIVIGHAVFVDGVMDSYKSPRFIGYYFGDNKQRLQLLHDNILNGLETSESVVWIYSEHTKWWEKPPRKDIDGTLRLAKADAEAGVLASPPSPALIMAETTLKTRISIGGKIQDANGKGLKPESWKPALANVACSSWGDEGAYGCDFPKGSDVVMEPVIAGKTFKPKLLRLRKVETSNWSIDWVVK
jgi:hypothetical protein